MIARQDRIAVCVLTALLGISLALADPCQPRHLSCDDIRDLSARKHCAAAVTPPVAPCVVAVPGPPGPQGPKGERGDTGPVGPKGDTLVLPIPAAKPKPRLRGLAGVGIGYTEEHRPLYHLFGGVQFPPYETGQAVQLQFGPVYSQHPTAYASCRIGCKTCLAHSDPAGPWGFMVSVAVLF